MLSKLKQKKSIKVIFIVICISLIAVFVLILFISPISKYLIEKYDEKYTGRKITMDWAYVNPLTGYMSFHNFRIYESKSDSLFFSSNILSLNISLLKLIKGKYEFTEVTLDHPNGTIVQNGEILNLDDLIKLFSGSKSDTNSKDVQFNLLGIKIINGIFRYQENKSSINYFIKNLNIKSEGKYWDRDTISAQFSFSAGIGSGDVKGDFTYNIKNDNYRLSIVAHKFDLNIIEQYLKQLSNYGVFSANFDADIKATGNLNDQENINMQGKLAINDFSVGKNKKDNYAAFNKLKLDIIDLSPINHKYIFDSVSLIHPYFKYELYDSLDNLETMFGKQGSNISIANNNPVQFNLILEIARYVKVLARNFFQSYYKINRLSIIKGDIKFSDYSISEKFTVDLNPLNIIADSIDKDRERVKVTFDSNIQPFGIASIFLNINPHDTADFDMNYHFQKLPAALFNPYTITYTSFPLDRGSIELKGAWNVRKGNIQSMNHLLILDPRATKRVKNKETNWLPLPLIFSFIRESGNVIDYEIPINGNLRDPRFHLKDVWVDLLKNIFVKPARTSYRMKVKNNETEIEKSFVIKWEMRQSTISSRQEEFIDKITDFLAKKPEASISVQPQQYAIKEKEYILFFEAKRKYYLLNNKINAQAFSSEDSEKVNKMSVKDPLFVGFLNKQIKDTMLFTIQEKCAAFIDMNSINKYFSQLNENRKEAFIYYFKEKGVIKQLHFLNSENIIPYNGFSIFKIAYNGEIPESLKKAYNKLEELNDQAPRNKFEEERRKNKNESKDKVLINKRCSQPPLYENTNYILLNV